MNNNLQEDIKEVRKGNAEVCRENEEIRRSMEFSQSEKYVIKYEVRQLQSALHTISENPEAFETLSECTRVLGDGTRAKNFRITGVEEMSAENSEKKNQR